MQHVYFKLLHCKLTRANTSIYKLIIECALFLTYGYVYAGTAGTNGNNSNAATIANANNNNNNNNNVAHDNAANNSTDSSSANATQKAAVDNSNSSNDQDDILKWLDTTLSNAGYTTAVTLKLLTVDKLIALIPCLQDTPREALQSLLDSLNTVISSTVIVPDEQSYNTATQWLKAYDTDMSDDDYISILSFMQAWIGRIQATPHRRLGALRWHHFDSYTQGAAVKQAYRELLVLAASKQRIDSIFRVCAAAGLKRKQDENDSTNDDVYILQQNAEAEYSRLFVT
jgi:hypothetical protein